MNYFDPYSSYADRAIVAAWGSQVKEADKTPWLAATMTERGGELPSCFAACYGELSALPRSARRALQRRIARSSELAAILPQYIKQGGRRLQRRMAWSLAGAALLLALGQGVARAATITVTTSDPRIIADGQCSLIEAIVNANNDAATHADCPAGSGADTIVLPTNANVILSAADNSHLWGLPLITSRITIEGNGAVIARQGNAPAFGLMAVDNSGDLTLQSVTLSGGSSSVSGGAVNNSGTLSIKNSTISGNTDNSRGGGGLFSRGGGGLFNFGTLSIENSTISGNTANSRGGGGIYNWYGSLTIENSTISGNTANVGGGVNNSAGFLTITNSTISGNRANEAGGLFNSFFDYGFGPSPATLTLNNSLIAGNQATVAPEIENNSIVTANNFNLFGSNGNAGVTGLTPGPTDIVPSVSLAQILGPLQNNGGPTQTHALIVGSPAIDAGDPSGCRDDLGALLLTDQRGFSRPFNGTICEIGSYEGPGELQVSPLNIGATTLATGEAGLSFTSDLMISGGVAPYIASITKGALPAGLSLGNDGIISGTISPAAKSATITVRITDSLNGSVSRTFTIPVLKALDASAKAKTGRVGRNYNASVKIKGGQGPFNWAISAGALPPGLNFNNATGALTGIPTQAGEFPLTVQVTDALGGVAVENLTLKIK